MRRVVVTGLGMVSPLACGVEETWKRLISGENAANTITRFNADNFSTNYACEIPFGDGSNGTFNPTDWMEPKERRKVDDFILYGMAAADMAVADSGWSPKEEEDFYRTGVMIGSGVGGLSTIADTSLTLQERGPRRVSPFFIPSCLINLISGQVSIRHGFKGPNHAVVTACSTGAHAIGDAALDGNGGYRSMKAAIKRAGLDASSIDYINAHGTSTMADTIELGAVERLLGAKSADAVMSSTKSAIGHLLGAAGAVEAIFSILAIRDQIAPPTLNLHDPVQSILNLAPLKAVEREINVVLSNSFGFGGTNASLVMGKVI